MFNQRKIKGLLVTAFVAFIVSGCAKKVERIGVDEVIDLSGRWNATDSRLVSEEMVDDVLSRAWINQHHETKGEKPTVIVGTVGNKTDEHIATGTFTKDLERALINSGRVQVVASRHERKEIREEREEMQEWASEESVKELREEEAADFMLKGVINSILDREGRRRVIFYQVNLELINTETNKKAWIGDKKIKKYITE